MREIVWPAICEIDGGGYRVLVSPEDVRMVGITLWKGKEPEVASRAAAEEIRPSLQARPAGL